MHVHQLGPLAVALKSGRESFHRNGEDLGVQLLDFWRWSCSDLVNNTMRGILAEFIVARALSIPTDCVRPEWGCYDLVMADGVRIEVKSAAYVQSWHQERLSTIQFVAPKRRAWDPRTNKLEEIARRHADVYVLALLAHTDKLTVDPMNVAQWQFWAVPTRLLDERQRSQHSITLRSLRALAGEPVDYWGLPAAVAAAR